MSRDSSLFRQQALGFRLQRRETAAALPVAGPLSAWLCWGIAGIFLLLLVLLFNLKYRVTESARGVLEPSDGVEQVAASTAAGLKEILVAVGEQVRAGQVLARLEQVRFDQQGRPENALSIHHLRKRRALLLEERQLNTRDYQQARQYLLDSRSNTRVRLQTLGEESDLINEQIRISSTALEAARPLLESAAISRANFDRQLLAHLELARQLKSIDRQRQELQLTLSALEQESRSLELEQAREELNLRQQMQELDHRLAVLKGEGNSTLVAPVDGIVTAIAMSTGQVVRPNQPIFSIRPPGQRLTGTVYVPSRIAGRLQPGLALSVRFDAFDFRHYGRVAATVVEISQSAMDPREYLLPVQVDAEPLFRVEVALERLHLQGEHRYALGAGAALTADFIFQEKSLLAYILEPVLGLRGKVVAPS